MNILLVVVDSLRADHLGCYGYGLPTSPSIDALASESILFERAFAAGIPTMPSFTTLLTGMHPYRHGIVNHVGRRRLSGRIHLLPQLARERGYVTYACDNLVTQGEGRGSWFARGYDHYSGFLYRPFSTQSTDLTDRALGFLDDHRRDAPDRPMLLFMHYWDPHSPYGPRPPYDTLHYRPGTGPVTMADVRRLQPEYYDAFVGDMKLRHPDDYAYIVAQYDGEISQVDAQIGRLFAGFRERGMWDDTIVVFLSDHGECFGEGDFYFDHHGLYDAVTRIAMLLRIPGRRPGHISALVSNEDIVPTLAGLVDRPRRLDQWSGTSLLPLIDGQVDQVHPHIISAESSRQASLGLRTLSWKVILPIVADAHGRPLPDFYGRQRDPAPLLFDLRADPGETQNLCAECPAQCSELLDVLATWREEMARRTGEPDPILAQGLSLEYSGFMARLLARR
jgi:arylsulfatase A-like enzyme